MLATDTPLVHAIGGGAEKVNTIPSAGAATEVDAEDGNIIDLTLDAASCALTFAALPYTAAGVAHSFLLVVRQDATGGRDIDWSGMTVHTVGGASIVLTADPDAVDMFALFTLDGGTTWIVVDAGLDVQAI